MAKPLLGRSKGVFYMLILLHTFPLAENLHLIQVFFAYVYP